MTARAGDCEGLVFDIDTFAVHDGPGIRMAVYLKGCPLNCRWCHSPESRRSSLELIYVRQRCTYCGACVAVCPNGVHEVYDQTHTIRRDRCVTCRRCVDACPAQSLDIKGYLVPASQVVAKASRLKPFFEHSGGGVTITGGEVIQQPDFAAAVLAGCRAEGIHTAIETSGACAWGQLQSLADAADLVLYDLKLMDPERHKRWVGCDNGQILDNARRLAGRPVQIRVPLIPGITDTHENVQAIIAFMRDAGLRDLALLPYNTSSSAKYEWLDLPFEFGAEGQDADQLGELTELATQAGLAAVVA